MHHASRQTRLSSLGQRLPGLILAAFCLWAIGPTTRLMRADSLALERQDPAAVAAAAALDPRASLYLQLALLDPQREQDHLLAALASEPRLSEAHLLLGWRAEAMGDPAAEGHFRKAAALDRRFRVRWAWLEFLARRGRLAEFWREAPPVFAMSYGDRQALFDLAWELKPDGRALLGSVIPDHPSVLFGFIQFLMQKGDLAAARAAYLRLVALPVGSVHRANAGRVATAEERRDLGLDLCDLLFDRRDPAGARQIWRALGTRGLFPAAASGGFDSEFRRRPSGRGFDWRVMPVPGVEQRPEQGWRMEFSGRQPDQARLLWRWLLLDSKGAPARIRTELETADGAAVSALWWRVTAPGSESLIAEGRLDQPLVLTPGSYGNLARLSLEYRRTPGEVALRGTVRLLSAAAGEGFSQ